MVHEVFAHILLLVHSYAEPDKQSRLRCIVISPMVSNHPRQFTHSICLLVSSAVFLFFLLRAPFALVSAASLTLALARVLAA